MLQNFYIKTVNNVLFKYDLEWSDELRLAELQKEMFKFYKAFIQVWVIEQWFNTEWNRASFKDLKQFVWVCWNNV